MKKIVVVLLMIFCLGLVGNVFARSSRPKPPFTSVVIYGRADTKYNRVSLFKSGSDTRPYKTAMVSANGMYTMRISIPSNMIKKQGYYLTDMRFWNDSNDNRIKDNDETRSQCHFIQWYPDHGKVIMQVYNGPTYEIDKQRLKYDLI